MSTPTSVKYQAQLDQEFAHWITGVVGGERLRQCIQCGQCSALCPLSAFMDHTPRQVMHLAREGFKHEALQSNAIWLCASCYGCAVECPKQIMITDVMYALKQRALREKVYPRHFSIPVLARAFFEMVRANGRITESWLVIRVFFKTNVLKIFGMSRLGLNLMRTGRFRLRMESIRGRHEVRALLDAVEAATDEGRRTRAPGNTSSSHVAGHSPGREAEAGKGAAVV
ncbi:MAG TPA: 4Fe-4S dicluster domain-containing protein [Chloroflexia bacterium]|nr:4Fe-4S dicluster domain-containing protein [Chloroflexia bacterium]